MHVGRRAKDVGSPSCLLKVKIEEMASGSASAPRCNT